MIVHAVLWHGALIGLYTCATDAAVASKALHHSTVVTCHLNAETTNGAVPENREGGGSREGWKNRGVGGVAWQAVVVNDGRIVH